MSNRAPEARAEIRMANEIDAGQAKGEIATDGRPETVRTPDSIPATLPQIGVTRQRLAEWRTVRDAARLERILDQLVPEDAEWLRGRLRVSTPEPTLYKPWQVRLARRAQRDLAILVALGFFEGSPLHLAKAITEAARRERPRYVPTGGREYWLRRIIELSGARPISLRTIFAAKQSGGGGSVQKKPPVTGEIARDRAEPTAR